MPLVTRADLRLRIREEADQVNSQFVSDAELNRHIESAARALTRLLVSTNEDYYTSPSPTPFTVAAGSNTIPLPSDFYKIRGLDRLVDGGTFMPVRKFEFAERGRYSAYPVSQYVVPVAYRVFQGSIMLLPAAAAPGLYQLWYVSLIASFTSDSDTFDGQNGWEEFIVIEAAQRVLGKEESDTSELARRKKDIITDIMLDAQQRAYGDGDRIVDTRTNHYQEDEWS